MKLDNIIYDKDSLQAALVEKWLRESPAFKAMYPSDTSTALTNVFASYGAMLQYMLVSAMANCYTDTAFSDRAIYQLATTLGNTIQGNTSSVVDVTIVKNNLINQRTDIPKNSTFKINNLTFFNPRAIRFDAGYTTSTGVNLIQGEVLTSTQITSGSPYERLYFSSDFKCNHQYITVKVNNEEWSVSDSFLQYDNTSMSSSDSTNVVVLKTDANGRSYIKFGDSKLGNLPPAGSTVQIEYVSCDGEDGNINNTGVEGELTSKITFLNQYNEEVALNVTVTTTTTAYGGANTQSIDVLRYSSPYIFASGHRAIRRQDYIAMFLNYCGYKTVSVWGEYEEANMLGAYDAIMMNMVYYTGLKTFETYPYDKIGEVSNRALFSGDLETSMGLVGSHSIKVTSKTDSNYHFLIQDNDGKGFLFINDDYLDPRDSLLPLWTAASSLQDQEKVYVYGLDDTGIAFAGDRYEPGDILSLVGTDLQVIVTKVSDSLGEVLGVKLNKRVSSTELEAATFSTEYVSGCRLGSGLRIKIVAEGTLTNKIVTTNDSGNNARPIINAKSDQPENLCYQSTDTPSLLAPVQIRFDFSGLANGKSITAIKLRAPNALIDDSSFVGTFAIYGTNVEPDYINVRNSKDWERVLDRTVVSYPGINNWTDWYATNVLDGDQTKSYRYYVMEIYSTNEDAVEADRLAVIGKLKLQFAEDASVILYENNSEMSIQLPLAGSAGPSDDGDYLNSSILDKEGFALYKYNIDIKGVTKQNGYANDNLLLYVYQRNNDVMKFYVRVLDIDNQIFKVYLNRIPNGVLIGNIKLDTEQSLDTNKLYSYRFYGSTDLIDPTCGGSNYHVGDIVYVSGSNQQLKLCVDSVWEDQGGVSGIVKQVHWLANDDGNTAMALDFNHSYDDSDPSTMLDVEPADPSVIGSGLKLKLISTCMSGDSTTPGAGGMITVGSEHNLEVAVTYKGNKVDSKVINKIDQPTINKYNHFTTYLEYKQPKIKQVNITVEVAVSDNSKINNTMILQDVSNSVTHLFDIKPDSIGKGLKLSDVYSAVMNTDNVVWCKVRVPSDNIPAQQNELLVLSDLNVIEVEN